MPRPRRFVPLLSLTVTLALGPLLAGVAMAADPAVVVRPGDTLTGISKRHGIPIAELAEINDLSDPNRIFAGQRLRLRSERPAARASGPTRPAPSAAPTERSHTVRSGEHLTGIARHYGVSIAAIVAANRLANPSRIYAGQRLVIPGHAAAPAPSRPTPAPAPSAAMPKAAAAARTHTVRAGEHLIGIARRYAITVSALVRANGITNPSRIYAGQRLTIPGAAARPEPRRVTVPDSMRAVMERRDAVRRVIVEEARRFDVPTALALAVAWQESGWQQGVVSHAGAIGVMQLLPATGAWVGETMLGTRVNLGDTRHNVRAGVRLLAHYVDRYRGNVDLVLAAYYQGQTAADRHGVYPVSRPYVASIKALVTLLGG